MKKILKSIYNWIKSSYYAILLICGMLGISQVASSTKPKDINILIVTISFFAIEYSIKNFIRILKEILEVASTEIEAENEFSKTFEEWYEDWFKKPFPTDKEKIKELKADCDLQSIYEYSCK